MKYELLNDLVKISYQDLDVVLESRYLAVLIERANNGDEEAQLILEGIIEQIASRAGKVLKSLKGTLKKSVKRAILTIVAITLVFGSISPALAQLTKTAQAQTISTTAAEKKQLTEAAGALALQIYAKTIAYLMFVEKASKAWAEEAEDPNEARDFILNAGKAKNLRRGLEKVVVKVTLESGADIQRDFFPSFISRAF